MSELLNCDGVEATERAAVGVPLNAEILGKLGRLFYELPSNAVAYCDVVTEDGDRRRIKRHPRGEGSFLVEGPRFPGEIDSSNPDTYNGLFILEGTLAAITRDSSDEGLEKIRIVGAVNGLLALSVG